MKRSILILSLFFVFLCCADAALSDCIDMSRATTWAVQDSRTIIYYSQNAPVAKFVLQDCEVSGSSNIQLTKTYMCDEDNLIVDGQPCGLMSLTSASTGF